MYIINIVNRILLFCICLRRTAIFSTDVNCYSKFCISFLYNIFYIFSFFFLIIYDIVPLIFIWEYRFFYISNYLLTHTVHQIQRRFFVVSNFCVPSIFFHFFYYLSLYQCYYAGKFRQFVKWTIGMNLTCWRRMSSWMSLRHCCAIKWTTNLKNNPNLINK